MYDGRATVAREVEGLTDLGDEPLGYRLRAVAIVTRQRDGELVTAEPRHHRRGG